MHCKTGRPVRRDAGDRQGRGVRRRRARGRRRRRLGQPDRPQPAVVLTPARPPAGDGTRNSGIARARWSSRRRSAGACRRRTSGGPILMFHSVPATTRSLAAGSDRAGRRRPRRSARGDGAAGVRRRPPRRRPARLGVGPRRDRADPPRHDDVHRGAQCTANFVYSDAAGATYLGLRRALRRHRVVDRHQRLHRPGSVPLGTRVDLSNDGNLARRGHDRRPRHAGLQLVAHRAPARHVRRQHLRLQRPRAGQGSTPATSPRSTRACPSGAVRPGSTPTAPPPATASGPTATPACGAACRRCRRTPASASATTPRTAAGATRCTPSRRASRATPARAS